jgi:hypothetical protein
LKIWSPMEKIAFSFNSTIKKSANHIRLAVGPDKGLIESRNLLFFNLSIIKFSRKIFFNVQIQNRDFLNVIQESFLNSPQVFQRDNLYKVNIRFPCLPQIALKNSKITISKSISTKMLQFKILYLYF